MDGLLCQTFQNTLINRCDEDSKSAWMRIWSLSLCFVVVGSNSSEIVFRLQLTFDNGKKDEVDECDSMLFLISGKHNIYLEKNQTMIWIRWNGKEIYPVAEIMQSSIA